MLAYIDMQINGSFDQKNIELYFTIIQYFF